MIGSNIFHKIPADVGTSNIQWINIGLNTLFSQALLVWLTKAFSAPCIILTTITCNTSQQTPLQVVLSVFSASLIRFLPVLVPCRLHIQDNSLVTSNSVLTPQMNNKNQGKSIKLFAFFFNWLLMLLPMAWVLWAIGFCQKAVLKEVFLSVRICFANARTHQMTFPAWLISHL